MASVLKKMIEEYDPNKKIEKPVKKASPKSTKSSPKKESPSYNKKLFKIKKEVLVEYTGFEKDVVVPDVVTSIGYPN